MVGTDDINCILMWWFQNMQQYLLIFFINQIFIRNRNQLCVNSRPSCKEMIKLSLWCVLYYRFVSSNEMMRITYTRVVRLMYVVFLLHNRISMLSRISLEWEERLIKLALNMLNHVLSCVWMKTTNGWMWKNCFAGRLYTDRWIKVSPYDKMFERV